MADKKSSLGCLLSCSLRDNDVLYGPLFTFDKLNSNKQGIPSAEAAKVKRRLIGAAVRFCPHGVSIDGHSPDHACGIRKDDKSIVANITGFSTQTDAEGREVLYAYAPLLPGVEKSTLPTSWSLLVEYDQIDKEGFVHGLGDVDVDLTNRPAYTEARNRMYPNLASAAEKPTEEGSSISDLNTKKAITESRSDKMADEQKQESTPAVPVVAPTPAPAAAPQTAPKVEQAAGKIYTQDEVSTLLKEMKNSIRNEAVTETRAQLEKESKAKRVTALAEKLGLVKPEDAQSKFETYSKLDKATLDALEADYGSLAAKLDSTKPAAKSLDNTSLKAPQEQPKVNEDAIKVLMKFGYSREAAVKAYMASPDEE